MSGLGWARHGDHHIAGLLPGFDISIGLDNPVQWVCPVDHGFEFALLGKGLDHVDILWSNGWQREQDLFTLEHRGDQRQPDIRPMFTQFSRNIDADWCQKRFADPERAFPDCIKNEIKSILCFSVILGDIINHHISTQ